MSKRDAIKKEFGALVEEAKAIVKKLLEGDKENTFPWDYQNWYSRALKSVQALAPDRYEEFRSYYEIDPKRKELGYGTYVIQDFLKGVAPNSFKYPDFDTRQHTLQCLFNQLTILNSLVARIDSLLMNIQVELYSELQDAELSTARSLAKINARAAGSIAGVVLEEHLQKVCNNHGIKTAKKNPGIADLNNALKDEQVYDTPTWRKISYLGDLRNICSHKKEDDPTKDQVAELIDGVDCTIKNVF